jgi:hypothetical protein
MPYNITPKELTKTLCHHNILKEICDRMSHVDIRKWWGSSYNDFITRSKLVKLRPNSCLLNDMK